MIYGYGRVSTVSQKTEGNSLESQVNKLIENGVPESNIFQDACTGTKVDRPEFNKLMEELKEGDTLVVTKLDRFARSLIDGTKKIEDLLNKGIRVNILNMGVMDNTPSSKLMRSMFFAFAEFERDMIVERTQTGKEIARSKGDFKEGRKPTYSEKQLKHASNLKLEGNSYKQVEEVTGISKPTLYRYMKKNNLLDK